MYSLNNLCLGHRPSAMPRILRAASSRPWRISSLAASSQILEKVKEEWGMSLRQVLVGGVGGWEAKRVGLGGGGQGHSGGGGWV
jgi:hypothetical protein